MIRIGIVGTGRITAAHLRGYQRLREAGYDDFRVTGLMSRNRADAETFRKRGLPGTKKRSATSASRVSAGRPLLWPTSRSPSRRTV